MNKTVKQGLLGFSVSAFFFFAQNLIADIPDLFALLGSLFFGVLAFILMFFSSSKKQRTFDHPSQKIEQQNQEFKNTNTQGGPIIQGKNISVVINYNNNVAEIKEIRESEAEEKPQISTSLSKSVATKELMTSEDTNEEREDISRRIKEAVEYLNKRSFVIARNLLYEILADIKGKEVLGHERARVYNNLGVSYNQPDENGDIDQAKKFFQQALTENPSLYQAKLNLGAAYIAESTEDSIRKGYETIAAIWNAFDTKEDFQDEKLEPLIGSIVWATYRFKGPELGIELIEGLRGQRASIASKFLPVLSLKAQMYAEIEDFENCLKTCEAILKQYPDDAETLSLNGRVLLRSTIKHGGDVRELELIPEIDDKENVKKALDKLNSARTSAETQNKPYLLPEIQMGIVQCQLLLGELTDSPTTLDKIERSDLSPELKQQLNVLKFTTYLQNRQFELAFTTLNESTIYKNTSYDEKKLIAKRFLYRGAPEQAELILLELEAKANEYKDFDYWLDIALINVMLDRKNDAISAANKAKQFASERNLEYDVSKQVWSNYSAILYRYVQQSGKDKEGRFLPTILEFQRAFPKEKIVFPIKAIDSEGKLTEEIKTTLTNQMSAWTKLRDYFVTHPVPTYVFVKETNRNYPDFICNRTDPEFTIEFTTPNAEFAKEQSRLFEESDTILLDYLSLLDLSSLDILGSLQKSGKKLLIHAKLFDAIQQDLIMYEIPELRRLWDFLRKSTAIEFIDFHSDEKLVNDDLSSYFDEWLVQSIKYANSRKDILLLTNDLRLINFLRTEKVNSINIYPLIDQRRKSGDLDKRAYSTALGRLANRFYTFLPFDHDDLAAIAFDDDYKLTPRTYHLVNQLILDGSDSASFMRVFVKFTRLLWKAEILEVDKINWLEFLTRKIQQLAEKQLLKNKQADLSILANGLGLMWKDAIDMGSAQDLKALLGRIDLIIDEQKMPGIAANFRKRIEDRLASFKKNKDN